MLEPTLKLRQVFKDFIRLNFEHLQRWEVHKLSGPLYWCLTTFMVQ